LATTTPELAVSAVSAIRGDPEIALGNAIGSVICDDGVALALAGIFAPVPIMVLPQVLKISGVFLLFVEVLAFFFIVPDYTLQGHEGAILIALFLGYVYVLFMQHKKGKLQGLVTEDEIATAADFGPVKLAVYFVLGLAGVIFSSEIIVSSAVKIASSAGVPKAVIALTIIALGTSIPEIATCVIAARKNEGALAVGNIIGADILNICWVAGVSSIANNLVLDKKQILFMFPAMFIIVGTMIVLLRINYRLTKVKGLILLGLYIAYLASFMIVFPIENR
jgi:cation:H+ antiporter